MEEPREIPPEEKALVARWQGLVKSAKSHWEDDFKRMERDISFAGGKQWPDQEEGDSDDRYVSNVTQRHIQSKVANLYARNPRASAKRRATIDFSIWDEDSQSIMATLEQVQSGGMDPQSMALLQDFNEGIEFRRQMNKIGKTLEIVWHYFIDEQIPTFKNSCKRTVRQTVTTGVGYVKVGYRREMERRPEDLERIREAMDRIQHLEILISKQKDENSESSEAELGELKGLLESMQAESPLVADEGLVYDFPESNQVIPDKSCKNLLAFQGCNWVAQEFLITTDEIEEVYGVDIKSGTFGEETRDKAGHIDEIPKPSGARSGYDHKSAGLNLVWEVYDKKTRMVYVICEGYNGFLKPPSDPPVRVEGFWPWRALMFNELVPNREDSLKTIYPPSDVTLLRPMQMEYNRARQGVREHRHANRPKWAARKGVLSDEDKVALVVHPANAVLELDAMDTGEDVGKILQAVRGPGIDPNMYDTSFLFDDIQRVGGSQEANFGSPASKSTATGESIAEGSRMSAMQSNTDDLDDWLTWVARVSGQILMEEMDEQSAMKIAGRGASWPSFDPSTIKSELFLEVKAGSSGRPNKAVEVANFERLAPLLIQIPGISPEWLARQAIRTMDETIDLTAAIVAELPSIIAMNAIKQAPGGDPQSDPNAQGSNGEQNAPKAPGAQEQQFGVAAPQQQLA